ILDIFTEHTQVIMLEYVTAMNILEVEQMKPLDKLEFNDLHGVDLVLFDCDGVTIERGTYIRESEDELHIKTNVISDRMVEKLNELKEYVNIGFSSGR